MNILIKWLKDGYFHGWKIHKVKVIPYGQAGESAREMFIF